MTQSVISFSFMESVQPDSTDAQRWKNSTGIDIPQSGLVYFDDSAMAATLQAKIVQYFTDKGFTVDEGHKGMIEDFLTDAYYIFSDVKDNIFFDSLPSLSEDPEAFRNRDNLSQEEAQAFEEFSAAADQDFQDLFVETFSEMLTGTGIEVDRDHLKEVASDFIYSSSAMLSEELPGILGLYDEVGDDLTVSDFATSFSAKEAGGYRTVLPASLNREGGPA